jgi:hypothetical protein
MFLGRLSFSRGGGCHHVPRVQGTHSSRMAELSAAGSDWRRVGEKARRRTVLTRQGPYVGRSDKQNQVTNITPTIYDVPRNK